VADFRLAPALIVVLKGKPLGAAWDKTAVRNNELAILC
jgi:hypothetical protein